MMDRTLASLRAENESLRQRVTRLEREVHFLRTHHVFAQGLKGETLVATLTGGLLSSFAEKYDVKIGGEVTIEVKFSKLNAPVPGRSTRRWNWSKPLGYKDKGKTFDFLVLIGEKDDRFPNQYLDDSPYIFFLVPKEDVPNIMTRGAIMGANVQINTHLASARSTASLALKRFIVPEADVSALLNEAHVV